MNIARFDQLLERTFRRTTPVPMHGEEVRKLRKPRPLAPLLDKALEHEDEIDTYAGSFEAWPGNVEELLGQHELMRSLLTFNSHGFGPISWSAGLVAIEPTGDVAYLCKWDEIESYQLLASVSSAGDSNALGQLVLGEIACGSVVQQPPHYVWNDAPDLLDRAAIEGAFARLLDRTDGWGALAEEHFGRIVEPTPQVGPHMRQHARGGGAARVTPSNGPSALESVRGGVCASSEPVRSTRSRGGVRLKPAPASLSMARARDCRIAAEPRRRAPALQAGGHRSRHD
jgi:hypothetical protein